MNLEVVKNVMQKVCPDILSSDNFMNNIVKRYCNGESLNLETLSQKEREAWFNLHDIISTATVGQVIKHLKENFKPTDKICYMDCIEGCKNDCTYVTKDQLGKRFFYYVKDLKERCIKESNISKDDLDNMYRYVNDNDVVVC